MKTIGILGVTYEATCQFLRMLIDESQVLGGKNMNPPVLLHLPTFARSVCDPQEREERWIEVMSESGKVLTSGGAELLVCPANSSHLVHSQVSAQLRIPWLSIIPAVADKVMSHGHRRVGILGTLFTVTSDMYPQHLTPRGISVVRSSASTETKLHEFITNDFVHGRFPDAGVRLVEDTISEFAAAGVSGCILACTELSYFSQFNARNIRLYDSTNILAQAALREAMCSAEGQLNG